jgi:2-dehydro-3-deoxyphosphogluconate aldolase / (4S)-4-hydroxy-2-oxoglutarate aldolase
MRLHQLIGAGTVLDPASVARCMRAGVQFIVSSGLNPTVVAAARSRGILVIVSALPPTKITAAWDAGSNLVKILPCDALGGAKYVKSISKTALVSGHLAPISAAAAKYVEAARKGPNCLDAMMQC